ncbi:MAG: YchJ family metal-binding protein [Pseudomonadota bacterium]
MPLSTCPCGRLGRSGRPLAFADCCGRYLDDFDNTPAPDAESLMRSRYSAFVLGRESYLRATWHASHRPDDVAPDEGTKWLGLEVRRHAVIDAEHAEVEFVARYRVAGRAVRIHERSRFVRENGRWYYVDGDLL